MINVEQILILKRKHFDIFNKQIYSSLFGTI